MYHGGQPLKLRQGFQMLFCLQKTSRYQPVLPPSTYLWLTAATMRNQASKSCQATPNIAFQSFSGHFIVDFGNPLDWFSFRSLARFGSRYRQVSLRAVHYPAYALTIYASPQLGGWASIEPSCV
jgi:hypothetical protein